MNRALAKWRLAGLGVVWDADDGPPEAPPAVEVIHVHYHVHVHAPLPVGIDQAGRIIQATPERAAITEGEQE